MHQDAQLGYHIRQRALQGLHWYTSEYPGGRFHPEIETCVCGCDEFVSRPAKSHPKCAKLHSFGIINESEFVVMKKLCVDCDKVYYFDGRSKGLINFRNYMIFSGKNNSNGS